MTICSSCNETLGKHASHHKICTGCYLHLIGAEDSTEFKLNDGSMDPAFMAYKASQKPKLNRIKAFMAKYSQHRNQSEFDRWVQQRRQLLEANFRYRGE